MRERIASGYDTFVLPFMIGMIFILVYLLVALVLVLRAMPGSDRKKLAHSLINPKILFKDIKDIFGDCILHFKIFKQKLSFGYMHASIAFGWFMIIVIGHIEVALFMPHRNGILYYPLFYRYFVEEQTQTPMGDLFFFLMDFFLLIILSGIALAIFKRIRATALGMKRTTKPSHADRIALYSLWAIFPLRLLAEGITAEISGGGFLTESTNRLLTGVFGSDINAMPFWWAYSIVLCLFFFALPFSRYMHIPTEPFFILLRNAGVKPSHPRKGAAAAEIYSCSSCGMCLDACPMNTEKENNKYSSVYFMRFLRKNNDQKTNEIADKCLMCGKCVALCPVSVDSCNLKRAQRRIKNNELPYNYNFLNNATHTNDIQTGRENSTEANNDNGVLYFAGCMTHLTPVIIKSMTTIFEKANEKYVFADKDGGVCCGRPLMLAGKSDAAKEVIEKNRELIQQSGCKTIVLSCPICMKVIKEEYNLQGITILHHTQYIDSLIQQKRLKLNKGEESFVFHDPCELGRGCNIYDEPRNVIRAIGELKKADKEKKESICCGGGLGSLTLNYDDRTKITQESLKALTIENPNKIVTACPLCMKTFGGQSKTPVIDIAQVVANNIV